MRAWSQLPPEAPAASWRSALPGVAVAVTGSQLAAAGLATGYVDDAAGARSGAVVDPGAFAGVASDGRPLLDLLFTPALATIIALRRGSSVPLALAAGLAVLRMIVRTQTMDAARLATGVAMAAHPQIAGYERVVRLPACKRCVVLAGRLYRWSDGFKRHPRCDCDMLPRTRSEFRGQNLDNHPRALFDRMTEEQQDRQFGAADATAIRDGADISKVVNADRGIATASRRRVSPSGRPTPEQIYRVADDRDDAIRQLRLHGFIL